MAYPRITIVTPSYQQAQYLEQTIDSVLSQGYPNLEYIIVDGGSTDGSVDIIKKHEKHLAWWVAEKDRGQAHALNKGFQRSTGLIQAYMNSDDYFAPGALSIAAELLSHPDATVKKSAWICGGIRYFDKDGGERTDFYQGDPPPGGTREQAFDWFYDYRVNQSSCFWTADLFAAHGPFNEKLRYVFDWEFFTRIRFLGGVPAIAVPKVLSHFRLHPTSKTVSEGDRFQKEIDSIWDSVIGRLPRADRQRALENRRRFQADRLQLRALQEAQSGHRLAALQAVVRSVTTYPPFAFQRRTLGCVRRAISI